MTHRPLSDLESIERAEAYKFLPKDRPLTDYEIWCMAEHYGQNPKLSTKGKGFNNV